MPQYTKAGRATKCADKKFGILLGISKDNFQLIEDFKFKSALGELNQDVCQIDGPDMYKVLR